MRITIEHSGSEVPPVVMKPTSTVGHLKEVLSQVIGLDPEEFTLQHKNKLLTEDKLTLEEYGLREGQEHIILTEFIVYTL